MEKKINVLTNIYSWYVLKRNRELYVHKEITFLQQQFHELQFFFLESIRSLIYGNFNFLLFKFIEKILPKRMLSKNPKWITLIKNFNYIPFAEIKKKNIDVVYSHEYFPFNLSKNKVPIIFDTRFPDDKTLENYGYNVTYARKTELWLKKFCIYRSSLVTLPTPEDAERLLQYFPDIEQKIRIVPWYLPFLEPVNKEIIISKHKEELIKILFVGNDAYRKGLDFLLKVFDEYLYWFKKQKITIYIVSNFRDKPNLKYEAQKLIKKGLPLKVFSNLPWTEVQKLMHQSHIFVFPTRADTYGLVLIEAMASGTAIITSTNSPQRWIVDYGQAGLTVPHEQKELFFNTLKMLITQKNYRIELALKGYLRFINLFYHKVVGEKLKNVFEEAVKLFNYRH